MEESPLIIRDVQDLERILLAHPAWRERLRQLLLSEDLAALPQRFERFVTQDHARLSQTLEQVGELLARLTEENIKLAQQVNLLTQRMERVEAQIEALTQRVNDLTERMERVEAQIEALTQRVNDLTERMERVEVHIATLTQRMDRVESQIEALAQQLKRNTDDLGELKGIILELRLPRKAVALYREEFRAIRVVPEEEWARLLDEGEEKGYLSGPEISDLSQVDGVIEAFRRSDNHPVALAVEVSAVGDRQDVERAARRAKLLARLYSRLRGYPVIGIGSVTARQFTQGARKLASVRGVVLKTFPIKLR
ncbi:MAG: hypothetical protein KatS3mg026_1252 [Bacteroidia bacterium]|nr:MAG: hypothetical protein KatS3mg026_1252 [Bacteroidia bacterium]